MQNVVWIILGLAGGLIVAYFAFGRKKEEKTSDTGLNLILTQINELSRTVDSKIGESHKQVSENLKFHSSESNKIIRDVTERLTRLDETNKQVISFADQLQSLENILKNPKQRGILGEYYLETVLKNVLPPGSYQIQYPFPDGTIVDAVVFVKDKIIPIDSKFSLENYNKMVEERDAIEKKRLETIFVNDLKNRITETAKYIQPTKGTTDFAFMFIPHEAIYYDLLTNKVGSLEENAKEIIKKVEDLGKHLKSYDEYHNKLGNALGTVVNHYNASNKELKKIDKDVLRISGTSTELALLEVEKPRMEE